MITNMQLVRIGAIGGMATVTMGLLFRKKLNDNVKDTEFYKESIKILRSHRGAVLLLGEPIKDKPINVFNENKNFFKENQGHFEVPISGQKQKGHMYLWVEKNDDKWVLNRIELELDNDSTKRLLIKSTTPKIS